MKRYAAIVALIGCVFSLCACRTSESLPSRTGFALDTVVTVTVYDAGDANADAVLDAAFSEINRLEALLSATKDNSDVMRLNTSDGQPVTVSAETADVLSVATRVARLSDGALDVTIHPVSVLWDFQKQVIPDKTALQQAAALVDYQKLHIDGCVVTLESGAVDLGGIAKGYIADKVADVVRAHGVNAALIDLGGNIVAVGSKAGEPFRIGIKDPSDPSSLCAIVQGADISAVTSGIYERGFDKDGVRYHHLLDPKTGSPIQNTLASVTVVCNRSVYADALSTACFVMGEDRAKVLIDSLPDTEALFVRRDGSIGTTNGLDYLRP